MNLKDFFNIVRAELAPRHLTVVAEVHLPNDREPEHCEWWATVPDPAAPHTIKFLPPRSGFAQVENARRFRLIGWQEGNKGEAIITREQIANDDGALAQAKATEILRQFP